MTKMMNSTGRWEAVRRHSIRDGDTVDLPQRGICTIALVLHHDAGQVEFVCFADDDLISETSPANDWIARQVPA